MDFTHHRYRQIIDGFRREGYDFFTFEEFIRKSPKGRVVILRHDSDRWPKNALKLARIEREKGVNATYYIRTAKKAFRPEIVKKIVNLGHEVGYHYEDLTLAKGDYNQAISLFKDHLEKLRHFYPVSTICMHGSPLSNIDNKLIWKRFDYRESGLIGEPYLDVDYTEVLYITDTGRRWNDDTANIRDRIEGIRTGPFESSSEIFDIASRHSTNGAVIITTHPESWHGNLVLWTYDLILQSVKNIIKTLIKIIRKEIPQ